MTDKPRIIGQMVTRNEMGRYLRSTIDWLSHVTDGNVHVHDDRSDDGTFEYLQEQDVALSQRTADEAPFVEHESIFRQSAWQMMEDLLAPRETDWVLCIDADELLLGTHPTCDTRARLVDQVGFAADTGLDAVTFDVAETFRLNGAEAMIRVDGYWGQIAACRLVRWRPNGAFADRREGCGSVPAAWTTVAYPSLELAILHLGYAQAPDRLIKYQRYHAGRGHNRQHIESILGSPLLVPWTGQTPPLQVST